MVDGLRLTELDPADDLEDDDLLYVAQDINNEPASRSVSVESIRAQMGGVFGNMDGGYPDSEYGGISPIDGGGV